MKKLLLLPLLISLFVANAQKDSIKKPSITIGLEYELFGLSTSKTYFPSDDKMTYHSITSNSGQSIGLGLGVFVQKKTKNRLLINSGVYVSKSKSFESYKATAKNSSYIAYASYAHEDKHFTRHFLNINTILMGGYKYRKASLLVGIKVGYKLVNKIEITDGGFNIDGSSGGGSSQAYGVNDIANESSSIDVGLSLKASYNLTKKLEVGFKYYIQLNQQANSSLTYWKSDAKWNYTNSILVFSYHFSVLKKQTN